MSAAECQCGYVVHNESSSAVAQEIYNHLVEVHPDMKAPEPDRLEREVLKAGRYGPKAAPVFLLYPKVEPAPVRTPWAEFFGRSTFGKDDGGIYAVRRKLDDDRRNAFWQVVRDLDTPSGVKTRMYSRTTVACVFLDGGITHVIPAYFGHADIWIHGSDALRLLCYKLDLVPPRRLKGETRVLNGIELEAELVVQRKSAWGELEERLERYLEA